MVTEDVKQKFQLVKGDFSPTEANDVVRDLIDAKINFHKVQRLKMWVGDEECDTCDLDDRIGELVEEKNKAKAFIKQAKAEGRKVIINGTLEITIE